MHSSNCFARPPVGELLKTSKKPFGAEFVRWRANHRGKSDQKYRYSRRRFNLSLFCAHSGDKEKSITGIEQRAEAKPRVLLVDDPGPAAIGREVRSHMCAILSW
ncbi:hypothetical protein [Bradyrhizobium australiense]|uniref:Uncharacterized protein n=1 Tax=Bradyrhizobium australiense TaxID=2721161 RepID=A0A7Y4LZD8_9BRAD|nr:hypothetical protein [Bradyrhizobium australiense]NOJ44552.1 hypothetical protein [Bradyrhizobium australiense]